MLITKTAAHSTHVLRMLGAMNFSHILIPRADGRDRDGVISLLTYEDWVAGKFCQRFGHHIVDAQTERAA
jgi:hypothetical protein